MARKGAPTLLAQSFKSFCGLSSKKAKSNPELTGSASAKKVGTAFCRGRPTIKEEESSNMPKRLALSLFGTWRSQIASFCCKARFG